MYKRQTENLKNIVDEIAKFKTTLDNGMKEFEKGTDAFTPVSYTHSDAADERSSVDLGGRRIIKKKKNIKVVRNEIHNINHKHLKTILDEDLKRNDNRDIRN